jgi:hypothetical protein
VPAILYGRAMRAATAAVICRAVAEITRPEVVVVAGADMERRRCAVAELFLFSSLVPDTPSTEAVWLEPPIRSQLEVQ